jgi:hypothetical protein
LILVIGERNYVSSLTYEDVAAWRKKWEIHPMKEILSTPVILEPEERAYISGLLPGGFEENRDYKICNLLFPFFINGSWNRKFARKIALSILDVMRNSSPEIEGLVLLGRYVANAMNPGFGPAPWGGYADLGAGVRLLPSVVVPAPGSRHMNDPMTARNVNHALKELITPFLSSSNEPESPF